MNRLSIKNTTILVCSEWHKTRLLLHTEQLCNDCI